MAQLGHSVAIGRRGQITLPSSLRKQLDLHEGDHLTLVFREDELVLRPVRKTLLDLRGSVAVSGPQDFDAIRRSMTQARAQHVAETTD